MTSQEDWLQVVTNMPWSYADCKPSDELLKAIFESPVVRQQPFKSLEMMNQILLAERVSPRRLTSAFNDIMCGMSQDEVSTSSDIISLFDRMLRLQIDIYYETFNLVAKRLWDEGLYDQAEIVMQRRSSMYHSSD